MLVHVIIYSTKHNPPKVIKYIIENSSFLFLWGFKMEMNFVILEFGSLLWNSVGKCFQGVYMNPV